MRNETVTILFRMKIPSFVSVDPKEQCVSMDAPPFDYYFGCDSSGKEAYVRLQDGYRHGNIAALAKQLHCIPLTAFTAFDVVNEVEKPVLVMCNSCYGADLVTLDLKH